MKWLFYILVLLNIAYFAYNLSYKDALIIPENSLHQSSDKSIVLLDEQNNNLSKQEPNVPTTEQSIRTEPAEITLNNNTVVEQNFDVTAEVEQEAVSPEQEDVAYITSIEIINQPVLKDLQKQEPVKQKSKPRQSSDASTSLSKDNKVKQTVVSNVVQNKKQTTQNDQKTINSCFMLGPFKKQILDIIKLELEQLYANRISFGIETTSKITYYRIYIPPLKSKELRNEALSRLDKHGMTDHYVMSIDGRKNAIALGVFKKRTAAEKVAARANKLGFSTTIEAISDDKNSLYNLQLELQSDEPLDPLNNLIEKKQLKLSQCRK